MKEETKSKLKKVGKRAGLGLALVSLFLLGVGVGACSARKAVGSSAEDNRPDLLATASVYSRVFVVEQEDVSNLRWDVYRPTSPISLTYITEPLSAGLYLLEYDNSISYYPISPFLVDSVMEGHVSFQETQPLGNHSYYDDNGDCVRLHESFVHSKGVEFFEIKEGQRLNQFMVCCYPYQLVSLRAVSAIPTEFVSMPNDYNPLSMFGVAYENASFGQVAGHVDPSETYFNIDVPIYFYSNGVFYDQIRVSFMIMHGMAYLDSEGHISTFTNADAIYRVSLFQYRRFGTSSYDVAWQSTFGMDASGNTYYANKGAWSTDALRNLQVVYYSPVYLSSLFPSYDQLELLKVRNQVYVSGADIFVGDSNPFSLLSNGFSALLPIFSVQFLPGITLGLLIFTPLVIALIIAIMKVLNK